MGVLKRAVEKGFRAIGYEPSRKSSQFASLAVELHAEEVALINFVLDSGYTMTSVERLVNTLKSCKYAVENDIAGDFVECGVWRGGNGILAKKVFERLGSDKKVWMFDTFEGMTAPTDIDVASASQTSARKEYDRTITSTHSEWCYASLEDVKDNCISSNLNLNAFNFIKGDVCKTLDIVENLPEEICVLRLDTDWYESTKAELNTLFPLLGEQGVLIIDDYGHWEGARKAVDEYFDKSTYNLLFNAIDYSGRSAIKQ